MVYDDIVVGGGTAGTVVAARLSEDPHRRVLLLEAGPDYPDGTPPVLRDARMAVVSGHNWDLDAIVTSDDGAHHAGMQARIARVFQVAGVGAGAVNRVPYPLGKVMGGGSAINAGLAFHARPQDWDGWSAAGNDWWSWASVQPAIAGLDIPVEVTPGGELTPQQRAFVESCVGLGYANVDLRQGNAGGVGVVPKNLRHGERLSTSTLYLDEARKRPNLTIRAGCLADRLLFERRNGDLAATAVEALLDGEPARFAAGRIVLAAGAIASPSILMRSGIGDPAAIRRAGMTPLLDLPAVGRNLQDHPSVTIWAVPNEGSCLAGEMMHQAMLQERSSVSPALCDLQLFMVSAIPTERVPKLRALSRSELAVGISAVVSTPQSRGRVELTAADPAAKPSIVLDCMREEIDLRRMKEVVRTAWHVMSGERFARGIARVVQWSDASVDSDRSMEVLIRNTIGATWHPVGTLRMGRDGEANAAVDQRGLLRGCTNVTVADASIMPAIPSVPTNLTCIVIAERIAAHLRAQ